jgi:hypothetical protein
MHTHTHQLAFEGFFQSLRGFKTPQDQANDENDDLGRNLSHDWNILEADHAKWVELRNKVRDEYFDSKPDRFGGCACMYMHIYIYIYIYIHV